MALSTLILANINWCSPAKKTFGRFPHRLIYSTHTLVINLVPRSNHVTVTATASLWKVRVREYLVMQLCQSLTMVIFSPSQAPLDLFSGSVFFLNAGQVIISGELFISNFVLFTCIWTHNLQKDKKGGILLSHQLGKQNIQANIGFITTYLSTLYQKSQFFSALLGRSPTPTKVITLSSTSWVVCQ